MKVTFLYPLLVGVLLLAKSFGSDLMYGEEIPEGEETALPSRNETNPTSLEDDTRQEESSSSTHIPNNNKSHITDDSGAKSDNDADMKAKQAEIARQRKLDSRKQEGITAVKRTIHAASSDNCDWKTQPVQFIKGEMCGSHYKVLGIDRKSQLTDKSKIKKKYRQLSLFLHPDKNPASDAEDAFNVLQGAYDCILDDECKENYDQKLAVMEEQIYSNRQRLKKIAIERSLLALNHAHYYISLAANRVYQIGVNFWEMLGDWQVTVFEESYPLGRPLAVLALLWKGQFLLKLHALSYLIIRINYELAKSRGWS